MSFHLDEDFTEYKIFNKPIFNDKDAVALDACFNICEQNKVNNRPAELTDRQKKIIELIKDNPKITLKELSKEIEVSIPTISRELSTLQALGIIFRTSNNQFGEWIIIKA